MQEKVINIVQETLRSGTFEGMSAILDYVDMTVVLPMLLRLFCFLRLLRFFWKEKRLLLFFCKSLKIECKGLKIECKGLKIKWLNLTGIEKILDAGKQNFTELDPRLRLCWTASLMFNIIDRAFDARKAKELRFITLPLEIEIKMVLLALFVFLKSSNNSMKFQPLNLRDLELSHELLLVFLETTFSSESRIIKELNDELFRGLGPGPSRPQNEWLNFTGIDVISVILVLMIEFKWIYLTDNGQVEEDTSFTYGQVEEDTSFTNAQRENGQVEEDTSFTNAQRENGQVEEDTSFTNAQRENGQVEEDTSFTNAQRENGQVEEDTSFTNGLVEEDTSFTNAQRDNGQVEEDTSFTNAQRENGQVEEEDTSFINAQRVFKIETLVTATDNFHYNNKLGEGGFGAVYKGTTHDGKQIAVKQLLSTSDRGRKEFLNEKLLAKIQHRNIVNLLGCCKEGSQMFVVYEYLRNGSLDKFLSDVEKRKGFDWQKRYNIILGIARALRYLHEDIEPPIVHRDIKASNILLDEKLNPKIADFGTAKQLPEDKTHVSTRLVGTFGYMAPEYAMEGRLSVTADVYSFGVVVLELVTGKRISSEIGLLGRIWSSYKQGKSVRTIDQAIIETCNKKQALRCIQIGLLCTQDNALLRPPMSEVTLMLSTPSVALPDPTKPPLSHEIHERGCCDIQ